MSMKANCSVLSSLVQEQVKEQCYYIDRVKVELKDLSARDAVEAIVSKIPPFVKATIVTRFARTSMRRKKSASSIAVGWVVEFVRLPLSLMTELADCLVKSHYTISELEIAFDLKVGSRDEAMALLDVLAEMIVIPLISGVPTFSDREARGSDDPETSHTSVFFGRYDQTRMFKMYVPGEDKKAFGASSVHTEFIVKGAQEIRRHGLYTLHDLLELDYTRWYGHRVWACSLDKQAIGAALRSLEGKDPAGVRQCQKDCDRVFAGEKAKAHLVYHHASKGLRGGLIQCRDHWLAGLPR